MVRIVASYECVSSFLLMIPGSEQEASSIITKVHIPSVTELYAKQRDSCGSKVSSTVFIK
jgi:hypothetical protein